MEYTIEMQEVWIRTVVVEAKDEREALRTAIQDGEGNDMEFSHYTDTLTWDVTPQA